MNLPVGAASLVLISSNLKPVPRGPAPDLDFKGAALLAAGTGCLLLVLSWGGGVLAWSSPLLLGIAAAAALAFALLVPVEARAAQPILPPELFRNRVFVLSALVLALATMALFSAVVFLPLMFQLLMGARPAQAGLMIAPLMGGVIIASVTGGRIVSRTGRYKMLPVGGLLTATLCYALLAWAAHSSVRPLPIEIILVVLGLGLGFVMPTLTTAIQNAVPRSVLGGATATAAFFRSLGGALGVAVAGAVLATHMQRLSGPLQSAATGVDRITGLSAAERELVTAAYRAGLSGAFLVGACIAGLGFLLVLFLPELPLRKGRCE